MSSTCTDGRSEAFLAPAARGARQGQPRLERLRAPCALAKRKLRSGVRWIRAALVREAERKLSGGAGSSRAGEPARS
eukprot:104982-Prymnesium_polylepis.1